MQQFRGQGVVAGQFAPMVEGGGGGTCRQATLLTTGIKWDIRLKNLFKCVLAGTVPVTKGTVLRKHLF